MSTVQLDDISLHGGTQPRVAISEETVNNYAEHMRAMAPQFPPVVVFFDGVDHWLADGFHRYHAARRIARDAIEADVHNGTRRDAVLFAACANQTHGLQRTNADKRKAVTTLLADEEWRQWSDREIGRRVGVDHTTVGDVRASLENSPSEKAPRTFITKHGTEATMNTARIGKRRSATRKEPRVLPDRSPQAVQARIGQIRELAAEGYAMSELAEKVGLAEVTCREIVNRNGIDVPASRVMAKKRRLDPNRIISTMAMQAENLTADTHLIDFGRVDYARLDEWLKSFQVSWKSLGAFIRRLEKERKKNVKAA